MKKTYKKPSVLVKHIQVYSFLATSDPKVTDTQASQGSQGLAKYAGDWEEDWE